MEHILMWLDNFGNTVQKRVEFTKSTGAGSFPLQSLKP